MYVTKIALLFGLIAGCASCDKAEQEPSDRTISAMEANHENAPPPRVDSTSRHIPLPSEDAPLKSVIEELEMRATRGDPRASCRIAAEYDYCSALQGQLDSINWTMRGQQLHHDGQPQPQNNSLQLVAEVLLKKYEHCEGIPIPTSSQRIEYWRNAAAGGHIPSMVMYSSGRAFKVDKTLDNLDQLRRYKAEAVKMAIQAASSGSGEAILALAVAYTPRGSDVVRSNLLAQVVAPDPEEALTLYLLLQSKLKSDPTPDAEALRKTIEGRVLRLIEDLPKEGIARAEQEADRRRRSWAQVRVIEKSSSAENFGITQDTDLCARAEFVDKRE